MITLLIGAILIMMGIKVIMDLFDSETEKRARKLAEKIEKDDK